MHGSKTDHKERPILFSGEMVRAILDGRKTQTRKVIKPQLPNEIVAVKIGRYGHYEITGGGSKRHILKNPPLQIGQTLWVRETFKEVGAFLGWDKVGGKCPGGCGVIAYRADGELRQHSIMLKDPESINIDDVPAVEKLPWRPSIHMPRWASRLTLEVTDVRVERVQDIDPQDCLAEGTPFDSAWGSFSVHPDNPDPWGDFCESEDRRIRKAFQTLWDSLNAKRGYSWESNPWVWVVTFKHVK